MVTHVSSLAFCGIQIVDVDVQVHIAAGIPNFIIVGLADKTIAESRERVKAALFAIGIVLPNKRILINLAPADLNKEGSHFDLAIACAILIAMQILPKEELMEYLILGELALDSSILPVAGCLPASMGAVERNKGLICSQNNGAEAAFAGNEKIIAAANLLQLINHFKGSQIISQPKIESLQTKEKQNDSNSGKYIDFCDVKGQKIAKRALEIAASGAHHLLMSGPPGTGKSLLAQCLPSILPPMSAREMLETSAIASISGNGYFADGLINKRPFRYIHHSCSFAAMVGGGTGKKVKPGEISFAHNGVLFLDELPEFDTNVLEALRQPLETGEIMISRVNHNIKYPANFQLIAAMNPCKCGYLSDSSRSCSKAPKCAASYQAKISGPIFERFDLHIEVSYSEYSMMFNAKHSKDKEESSREIYKRVKRARELQFARYQKYDFNTNSRLDGNLLNKYASLSKEGIEILNKAAMKFNFSMRVYNKILRVARTIADLEGEKDINKSHIAEALSYRKIDFLKS